MNPRSLPRLAVLLVAPALAAPALAQQDHKALAEKLDAQFKKAYPAGEPGAAVIVTKGGQTILRKGYGLASVELGVEVGTGHAFCLASVTKPFTAMGVMALVEDGKVKLSDKAAKYFPKLELDDRITVEHLLSHTAGIPDFTRQKKYDHSHIHARISPEELCAAAKGQPLMFDPGTKFKYSNIHYALLGRIIEIASGESWEAFLKKRIFDPAGMRRTMFGGHERIVPHAVTGYARRGGKWQRSRALSYTRGYGLGGLLSTVDDLAAWNRAFNAGKILKPATVERMMTAPKLADGKTSQYALGWIVRDIRGHRFEFHAGGIYGWVAMLVRIPKQDVFVAVLTNRDDRQNPAPKLATGAAALVAGNPK